MSQKKSFGETAIIRSGPQNRGFTLIELLVVLMIIGLGSGLVGPVIFKVYKQLRMKIESERIDGKIELASARAFFQQQERKIKITHDRLLVMPDKIVMQLQFQPEGATTRTFIIRKTGLNVEELKIIKKDEAENSGEQERFYSD